MEYKCDICDKPFDLNYPKGYLSPHSYNSVCDDHKAYHLSANRAHVQKKLNIISDYPDHLKKCLVCDKQLSPEELSVITQDTVNHVCAKHSEVADWFQSQLIKPWFKFKEQYPNAQILGEENINGLILPAGRLPLEFWNWWEQNQEPETIQTRNPS